MEEKIIRRGDLFYYDFGNNIGSVQHGERPVLYPAHKSQRLFYTFGVIPDDIIINFIYKSLRKNSS